MSSEKVINLTLIIVFDKDGIRNGQFIGFNN